MDKNQTTEYTNDTTTQTSSDWKQATGELNIKLVNDYLFRALLQKNNRVLKGVIASLLHMKMEDIQSVIIKNEIILGKHIPDKAFILDIRVLMNDNSIINLEMQVVDQCNWVERSMSYLCRCFDNLSKGDDYINAKPVVQIGLLDYTLFPDAPEFYASYYLMNEKSHKIYSDKLRISVVDLTHIDLATDEDKLYGIDHWARLFKSRTWEDLKMLAENNPIIDEAASTIYSISQDNILLEQIRARDEAIAHENYLRKQLEEHIRARDEAIAHENYLRKQLEQKDKQMEEHIRARDEAIAHENYLRKQMEEQTKQRQEDALLIESLRKEIEELRLNQK